MVQGGPAANDAPGANEAHGRPGAPTPTPPDTLQAHAVLRRFLTIYLCFRSVAMELLASFPFLTAHQHLLLFCVFSHRELHLQPARPRSHCVTLSSPQPGPWAKGVPDRALPVGDLTLLGRNDAFAILGTIWVTP